MREIKFRYMFQHGETGRIASKIFKLNDLDVSGSRLLRDMLKEGYSIIAKQQYIGLESQSGCEIYEGDIVKSPPTPHLICPYIIYEVIWARDRYSNQWSEFVLIPNKGSGYISHFKDLEKTILFPLEIIGDIYNNQELLKKETTSPCV